MAFLDRLRRRPRARGPVPAGPAAAPVAAADLPDDVVASVTAGVRGGFRTREEVLEAAEDRASEAGLDRAAVAAYVDRVWRARLDEQRTWPATTDADRLDAAFAELDADGVVARMDFTCCQTCGVTEIDDEVRPGQRPAGYVFFHQQDSERLDGDDAALLLSYGAFGASDAASYETAALDVGHRVRAALERAGLTVAWSGSTSERIRVTGLDWRRRLPA